MIRAAAAAALTLAGAPAPREVTMKHATGTFEVKVTPEASVVPPAGGVATGRMGLAKTFSGGMAGTALGTMLTAGTPGGAMTYVAIDQFDGSVDGRRGGFVLAHRGTMTAAGAAAMTIEISVGSGTDALSGIAGTLTIEIKDKVHHYDLSYALSDGK